MGINPITYIKNSKKSDQDIEYLQRNQPQAGEATVASTVPNSQKQESMRLSDVFVLKMFKTMGLSENTMALIENDLRTSQARQQNKEEKKSDL